MYLTDKMPRKNYDAENLRYSLDSMPAESEAHRFSHNNRGPGKKEIRLPSIQNAKQIYTGNTVQPGIHLAGDN